MISRVFDLDRTTHIKILQIRSKQLMVYLD